MGGSYGLRPLIMYTYIYTYIYMYICTYIYTFIHIFMHILNVVVLLHTSDGVMFMHMIKLLRPQFVIKSFYFLSKD